MLPSVGFLHKWAYFFKKAFQGIREALVLHLLTIGTICISLVIFGAFLMILHNLNLWVVAWGESRIQVTAYLKKGVSMADVRLLQKDIRDFREVKAIRFISEAEALSRLKDDLGPQAGILEGLKDNPLPASLDVSLRKDYRTSEAMEKLALRLKSLDGIDEVLYGQEWMQRLLSFINLLKVMGVGIGGLLMFAVIFIISNTIKLTVFTRLEEIEIMRLVGATEVFIKAPFIIEGMIQGLLGALFAIGALFGLYLATIPAFEAYPQISLIGIRLDFLPWNRILHICLGGIAVGIFGSFISLIRFIKQ
jgi:cell division transport system permease protein